MANSFPDPIVLPDPNAVTTGQVLRSTTIDQLCESVNFAHAYGRAINVVTQEFQDTLCGWNTTTRTDTCVWRIPALSAHHSTATVEVYGSATTAAGSVRFASADTGDTVDVAVNTGADAYYTGSLDIATSGYDTITMSLTAGIAGTITILYVRISIDPLSSPLPTTTAGDFTPFGISAVAADECLPAWKGHRLIESMEELRDNRPRVLLNKSGLANISGYKAGASSTLVNSELRQAFFPLPGSMAAGETYTVWVYCDRGASDERVVINAYPFVSSAQIDIESAGASPVWKSATFVVDDSGDPPYFHSPRYPTSAIMADVSDYSSGAAIKSIAVWGP